jgi:hypothetical protein
LAQGHPDLSVRRTAETPLPGFATAKMSILWTLRRFSSSFDPPNNLADLRSDHLAVTLVMIFYDMTIWLFFWS